MHRTLYNELRLEWQLLPVTPLLVSAGEGRFIRTVHPEHGTPTAFVPGSAFRGMLRVALEGIVTGAGLMCCDPLNPCSEREEVRNARTAAAAYKAHCPACRLFGSNLLRGRVTLTDLYPEKALDELNMHPLTDGEVCEAVTAESFKGTFVLQNFERWQVALLGLLLGQINAGHLTFGANRSAGMGRVFLRYQAAALTYFGFYPEETWSQLAERVYGAGALAAGRTDGFQPQDVANERDLPNTAQFDSGFGFARVLFTVGDAHSEIEQLFFRQLPAWEQFLTQQRS
jgi:CRISPR/Cas system CSM-associated protein Csm3 (group 7 of RAMP superfamily)